MRLWSIHPEHLDSKGLLALWREGLLAQHVLAGLTAGYRHHPQLDRFRKTRHPLATINRYLKDVWTEADRRGYRFDRTKVGSTRGAENITVTDGQIAFETAHLLGKLRMRDPARHGQLHDRGPLTAHPLFVVVSGAIEPWERIADH